MEHKDVFLLETIVEFCDRITDTIKRERPTLESFKDDLDLQDVCAFRILQIGENANNLSEQFKNSHPEVKWHKIVGFRHNIAHEYGGIDVEILWDSIINDIPELRAFCAKQIGLE